MDNTAGEEKNQRRSSCGRIELPLFVLCNVNHRFPFSAGRP